MSFKTRTDCQTIANVTSFIFHCGKLKEISCVVNACSSLLQMLYFKLLSSLPRTNPEKDLIKCCDRLDMTTMTTCQTETVAFDLQAGFHSQS